MTRQKSFKSHVRARMAKTGERYAAARRRLVETGTGAEPSAPNTGAIGAMSRRVSDDAVQQRTGSTWAEWFGLLDAQDATAMTHTEIARWLRDEVGVDGWWAQSVTVAYEQERGMRVAGQRPDGTFDANATKTIRVGAERATEAFSDETVRRQWLPDTDLEPRVVRPGRRFTAGVTDGPGRITVGFDAKGDGRCQVALTHARLPDADTATQRKQYWRERLSALKELLET